MTTAHLLGWLSVALAAGAAVAGFGWPAPASDWTFNPGADQLQKYDRDTKRSAVARKATLLLTLAAVMVQGVTIAIG